MDIARNPWLDGGISAAYSHELADLPYKEGDVFLIPLRDGGYSLGVVARIAPGRRIVLGYFFGPKRSAIPASDEWSALEPSAALARMRFGDLHLINGKWTVLGTLHHWNRELWPMPRFLRQDILRSQLRYIVTYDPGDPSKVVMEVPESGDLSSLERDALYGAVAVEIRMAKLLNKTAV